MSNLQKQYQLIQEIHQLLPQVCVKNNIEKIEVENQFFVGKDGEIRHSYQHPFYNEKGEKIPSLFYQNPEQVLTELVEIFQKTAELFLNNPNKSTFLLYMEIDQILENLLNKI